MQLDMASTAARSAMAAATASNQMHEQRCQVQTAQAKTRQDAKEADCLEQAAASRDGSSKHHMQEGRLQDSVHDKAHAQRLRLQAEHARSCEAKAMQEARLQLALTCMQYLANISSCPKHH